MREITDVELKEMIGSKNILVDFYAPWCGPCKYLAPILEDVSKNLNGKVEVVKVNIEASPGAISGFGIKVVPTLLFFKANGESIVVEGRGVANIVKFVEGYL